MIQFLNEKIAQFFSLAILSCVAFAALALSSCSSMQEYQSTWKTPEIKIDGDDSEWQDFAQYFPEQKVALSVKNDSKMMYIFMKTNDQSTIRKIMGAGMTIWLNGEGNDDKTMGIRFPVGMSNKNMMPKVGNKEQLSKPDFDEMDNENEEVGRTPLNRSMEFEPPDIKLIDVQLLKNDSQNVLFTTVDEVKKKYNISLAMKQNDGALVYEIAIPINSNLDVLNDIKSKNNVYGLGIETAEMKKPDFQGNKGGMPPDGGMQGGGPSKGGRGGMQGGGGRPPMGGGGGMPPGGRGMMDESSSGLKIWLELKLADGNADNQKK